MIDTFEAIDRDRPIIFSEKMVEKILSGEKTQTRRVIRPQPELVPDHAIYPDRPKGSYWWSSHVAKSMMDIRDMGCLSPYGYVRNRLWVREAFKLVPSAAYRHSTEEDGSHVPQTIDPKDPQMACIYRAGWSRSIPRPWQPSIYMPRWASRITLKILSIRAERLHDITEEDAKAEGVPSAQDVWDGNRLTVADHWGLRPAYRASFCDLWSSINGKRAPWAINPWVWRIEFERVPQDEAMSEPRSVAV